MMRTTESMSIATVPDEPGRALGCFILTILLAPQAYALLNPSAAKPSHGSNGLVFTGLYIIFVGCVFLASYFYSHKSFLFRWFIWLCERGSFPATRKMAFFYFLLCAVLGSLAILDGLGIYRA
jgi:hypothetical protein